MERNEKFCPKCGELHEEDANFCRKCGTSLDAKTITTEPLPDHAPEKQDMPDRKEAHVIYETQKSSGFVTFLSVIGFVFGLVGMLLSFLPIAGMFAKFISIPAMVISVIAFMIALAQKANKTFAIVACTVCGIGIVLSQMQMSALKSGIQGMQDSTQRMQESTQRMLSQGGAAPSSTAAPQNSAPPVQGQRFGGIFEGKDNIQSQQGISNNSVRKTIESAPAPATVAKGASQNLTEEQRDVVNKVYDLYEAYKSKNLDSYMNNIDDNAIFRSAKYSLQGKDKIRERRVKTFAALDNFDCKFNHIDVNISGNEATVNDSLKFSYTKMKTGQRLSENVNETFKLRKIDSNWLIVENIEH